MVVRARHHPSLRPRLYRLQLVRAADPAGRLLRHPSEGECGHHRGRGSESFRRKGLVSDQIICLTQQAAETDNPPMMRRIEYFDDEQQRTLVFLTNNMKLAAATAAEIYKSRWQIELFLKR